jgi:SRSO17 transposase
LVSTVGARLQQFWQRYAPLFRTQTRDGSAYAYHYLSGLLRLPHKRTFVNIGRQAGVAGQNVQHFISNSPWSASAVITCVQEEIRATPGLEHGGMLLLDESADRKAGTTAAGAGRQRNGRLGSVQLSQVGTFLAYVHTEAGVWTWVDGELFLPQDWFTSQREAHRTRVGVPAEREFETKLDLGWRMIQRATVPYEAVACDTLYGRSVWLRRQLAAAGIVYIAEVPAHTQVYLTKPVVGIPPDQPRASKLRVLEGQPLQVRQVAARADMDWHRVPLRHTERGLLADVFAARLVWTAYKSDKSRYAAVALPVQEWLVVRVHADGTRTYALCNAPADTSLERLAWLKVQRYFIERTNQDAKSELGWADFAAQKYRAWEHHLALTILAAWFVAQTKLEWVRTAPRAPAVAAHYAPAALPALSTANVRELLRAALPLPQLSPQEAVALVIAHLVNRARARRSRRQRQLHTNLPP